MQQILQGIVRLIDAFVLVEPSSLLISLASHR